jgi:hypothetical protein
MKHTQSRPVKRSRATPSSPPGRSDLLAGQNSLLDLQATAGNQAVNRLIQRYSHSEASHAQRAPAAAPARSPGDSNERNDFVDLLNGVGELALTAVNEGGRRLETVRFGPDLSPAHRRLLGRMRTVLIQAQDQSPEARRAAIAGWPGVEARVREAMQQARLLRIPMAVLSVIDDDLDTVRERYVHARQKGPSPAEDYTDFTNGVSGLLEVVDREYIDKDTGVAPTNIAEINARQRAALGDVSFGPHLSENHRNTLNVLRTALICARTESPGSARAAQGLWQSAKGDVVFDLKFASKYLEKYDQAKLDNIQQLFKRVGKQLIQGGVYSEAHNKALEKTNLSTPELVYEEERLKNAVNRFEMSKQLADKATELTGKKVMDIALEEAGLKGDLGSAIYELVRAPHEIHEWIEEYKKKGVISKAVSIADLTQKFFGLEASVSKVSAQVLKQFALGAIEVAKSPEVIMRWTRVAEWATEKLEVLEKVGTLAERVGYVISAIKVIDALRRGKLGEALKEAGTTAAGYVAGVAVKGSVAASGETSVGLAAGGVAVVGGSVVAVAVVVDSLHSWAEMLRYCEKESVREATATFVNVCTDAWEAKELVADVMLLQDPSNADQSKVIEQKLVGYAPYWNRHMEELASQLNDTRTVRLGGQPKLKDKLGADAQRVLQAAGGPATWQEMSEQIRIIFAGASEMAKWAVENYPRSEKPQGDEGD